MDGMCHLIFGYFQHRLRQGRVLEFLVCAYLYDLGYFPKELTASVYVRRWMSVSFVSVNVNVCECVDAS